MAVIVFAKSSKLLLPSIAAFPLLMAYAGHTTIIIPKPLVSYIGLKVLDLGMFFNSNRVRSLNVIIVALSLKNTCYFARIHPCHEHQSNLKSVLLIS